MKPSISRRSWRRVLAELGEPAAARAAYAAFLRCWADPDRPIPEVAVARRRVELT